MNIKVYTANPPPHPQTGTAVRAPEVELKEKDQKTQHTVKQNKTKQFIILLYTFKKSQNSALNSSVQPSF